jgi:hypothetical protein
MFVYLGFCQLLAEKIVTTQPQPTAFLEDQDSLLLLGLKMPCGSGALCGPEDNRRDRCVRELALMEACDISRVSRHEDLRSAFRQSLRQESLTKASCSSTLEDTTQNADGVPKSRPVPFVRPLGATRQDSLDPLEKSSAKAPLPPLSLAHITQDMGYSNRAEYSLETPISTSVNRIETCSPRLRSSASSPLLAGHEDASPDTATYRLADSGPKEPRINATDIPIRHSLISSISSDVTCSQDAHTQRIFRTPSPEYIDIPLPEHISLNSFCELNIPDFDGRQLAREFVDYMKRSSHYSEWEYNPDQIDRSSPKPVLRRASSWVVTRLHRGTNRVAYALGMQSEQVLSVDSDRCYNVYCKLPSCHPERKF